MDKTIAVIGLRHGARHVAGFLAAGVTRMYAVDISAEARSQFVGTTHVTVVDNYLDILPKVDMAVISLPAGLHKAALAACRASHVAQVWVEKPLLGVGEYQDWLEHFSEGEVIYELRRSKELKHLLEREGNALSCSMGWFRPAPKRFENAAATNEVLYDLGTHLVDLVSYVMGESAYVDICDARKIRSSSKGYDCVGVAVTLQVGKQHASIEIGWVDADAWPQEEITLQLGLKSKIVQLAGYKQQHRHLTAYSAPNSENVASEKNWYYDVVQGVDTGFPDIPTAAKTQQLCNTIMERLAAED